MTCTRREFVESCGAALLGFTLWKAGKAFGDREKVAEVPLLWIDAAACGGCTSSLLGSASPRIEDALLAELLPGKHVSLSFQARLMAPSGQLAMRELEEVATRHRGKYILIVEGAIPTKAAGRLCELGQCEDGRSISAASAVIDLAKHARAVLSVGTCASFGGLPAAPPNPTGAVGVGALLRRAGIKTTVVNIPGCPPNPDWIVGTLSAILLGGNIPQDKLGRPKAFYSTLVHDHCPYRGDFDRGRFAEHFGQHACLFKLGCKGQVTYADCPVRHTSSTQQGCIGAGHPCIGCTRSDFPFATSLFDKVEPATLGFPAVFPEPPAKDPSAVGTETYVTIGLLGVGGFLAGLGVGAAARRLQKHGGEPHDAQSAHESESGTSDPGDGEKGEGDASAP